MKTQIEHNVQEPHPQMWKFHFNWLFECNKNKTHVNSVNIVNTVNNYYKNANKITSQTFHNKKEINLKYENKDKENHKADKNKKEASTIKYLECKKKE